MDHLSRYGSLWPGLGLQASTCFKAPSHQRPEPGELNANTEAKKQAMPARPRTFAIALHTSLSLHDAVASAFFVVLKLDGLIDDPMIHDSNDERSRQTTMVASSVASFDLPRCSWRNNCPTPQLEPVKFQGVNKKEHQCQPFLSTNLAKLYHGYII